MALMRTGLTMRYRKSCPKSACKGRHEIDQMQKAVDATKEGFEEYQALPRD